MIHEDAEASDFYGSIKLYQVEYSHSLPMWTGPIHSPLYIPFHSSKKKEEMDVLLMIEAHPEDICGRNVRPIASV